MNIDFLNRDKAMKDESATSDFGSHSLFIFPCCLSLVVLPLLFVLLSLVYYCFLFIVVLPLLFGVSI